jgi:predicted nucleic acid-binding protein
LSVYLDASVLVALFSQDSLTTRADALLRTDYPAIFVSDLATAEFASSISRRVRMNEVTRRNARKAFEALDEWMTISANRLTLESGDIAMASGFLRRLDLPLRTADAMHIAAAARVGATLATFDVKMAVSAKTLGLIVLDD